MSFKKYVKLKEMAVASFGKVKGKHINDIDKGYATWMLQKINDGDANFKFTADDGSGFLSPSQIKKAVEIRVGGGKVAPTSTNEPIRAAGDSVAQKLTSTIKSNAPTRIDPVASRIIERLKESNNVLSRLADYFGSAYSNPELNKETRAKFEKQIKFNLNAIDKAFPQADVPMLISRLKNLYKFFISKEPRRDYKLRLDYHDEFQHIEMLLADVLGDKFADL